MALSPRYRLNNEGDGVTKVRSQRHAHPAVTKYRVLDSRNGCSLVELQPLTGKNALVFRKWSEVIPAWPRVFIYLKMKTEVFSISQVLFNRDNLNTALKRITAEQSVNKKVRLICTLLCSQESNTSWGSTWRLLWGVPFLVTTNIPTGANWHPR